MFPSKNDQPNIKKHCCWWSSHRHRSVKNLLSDGRGGDGFPLFVGSSSAPRRNPPSEKWSICAKMFVLVTQCLSFWVKLRLASSHYVPRLSGEPGSASCPGLCRERPPELWGSAPRSRGTLRSPCTAGRIHLHRGATGGHPPAGRGWAMEPAGLCALWKATSIFILLQLRGGEFVQVWAVGGWGAQVLCSGC